MITARAILLIVFVIFVTPFLTGATKGNNYDYTFRTSGEIADAQKFMELRNKILRGQVREEKRDRVMFAIAEYYFKENTMSDARRAFEQYVQREGVDISKLLANVYLYKIAERIGDDASLEQIKKRIFEDKFVLLFNNFKTIKYESEFENEYEVKYFVDRIEVVLNGDTFAVIIP